MTAPNYRSEIDGLRALAVVPVILFHAGVPFVPGGFVGVDVFFVISGYLITGIIWREILEGKFSLWEFYERRARRILPALLTMCLLTLPFAWMWLFPDALKDYAETLVAVLFSVSNFVLWSQSGYFQPAAELNPLVHTWTLAIEEQFYLLFPLFLMVRARVDQRAVIALLATACIFSLILSEYMSSAHPTSNFYLLPTRAWELGVGSLVQLTVGQRRICGRPVAETAALAGVVLIVVAVAQMNSSTPFPSFWALVPVLGTLLILIFGRSDTFVGRILSLRPVVFVGLISYSAYLFHQPLFAFSRLRFGDHLSPLTIVGLIALTFVLATISWRFVERPFRDREKLGVSALVLSLAPAALIVFAIGLGGILTDGYPGRKDGLAGTLQSKTIANYGLSKLCEDRFTLNRECRTSELPRVLIWGDSYAMHLVDLVRTVNPNVALVQHTKSACGPILGVAPIIDSNRNMLWAKGCLTFNDSVRSYVDQTPSLRIAIISSQFRQYLADDAMLFTKEGSQRPDPVVVAKHIRATIGWLEERGIRTILVSPPPSDGSDLGRCLALSAWMQRNPRGCDLSRRAAEAYDARVLALLHDIDRDKDVVFLSEFMCEGARCASIAGDGVFIYQDAGHLSVEGSAELGRRPEVVKEFYLRKDGLADASKLESSSLR